MANGPRKSAVIDDFQSIDNPVKDAVVLREVAASAGEYKAFPIMAKTRSGRLVVMYWRGNGHSPAIAKDNLGQIDAVHSDDNGETWSNPVAVYGNISNGDPYFAYYLACGNDRRGNIVLVIGIFNGTNYVLPHITRSVDGVGWSSPIKMTITGSSDVHAATLIPFGSIELLPSGKMILPVYQTTFNWAGLIDDNLSETTLDLTSLIVNSSSPAYSECALCPITERVWWAFLRQDGATNAIPAYRTVDAGQTWISMGSTGLPVGGGYLVQAAFHFVMAGETHLGLLIGARKSESAPITSSPGIMLAASPLAKMRPNNLAFRRIHFWRMADDGAVRDAYAGYVFDQVSNYLMIITHEELDDFSSRILFGSVDIRK